MLLDSAPAAWLLLHPMAPYTLWWAVAAGVLATTRRSLRAVVVTIILATAAGLSFAAALDIVGSVPPVINAHGMSTDGVWWVVTAVVLATTRKDDTRLGWLSALPLAWLGPLGGGALACAVLIVATAALEPGRPGRWGLLVGTVALGSARWLDHHDLTVWIWLGRVDLGGELGSLLITVLSALLGGLGVAGVTRGLSDRLDAEVPLLGDRLDLG